MEFVVRLESPLLPLLALLFPVAKVNEPELSARNVAVGFWPLGRGRTGTPSKVAKQGGYGSKNNCSNNKHFTYTIHHADLAAQVNDRRPKDAVFRNSKIII